MFHSCIGSPQKQIKRYSARIYGEYSSNSPKGGLRFTVSTLQILLYAVQGIFYIVFLIL